MAITKCKPTTSSRRRMSFLVQEITKKKPEKSLLAPWKSSGGRNNLGRITLSHRGGGAKRRIRIVDFKRKKYGKEGVVSAIEYDPNRSANIALLKYDDGKKAYIIAPQGIQVGDSVVSSLEPIKQKIGNTMSLKNIMVGTEIYNIELRPGKGGQLVRSAGTSAQLIAKEGNYAHIKLPSGEVRKVLLECKATIGRVGNVDWELVSLGKAGRSRHRGIRPKTRGVAMNPHDHPMGGGEGKTSGGRHPCSKKGLIAKGKKTRKKNALSNKFIIKRRK
ncbi:TPA: 50S ribosomal protein L2 [bacterium]|nr:50S ribosomal protein L2 [bacterium]